MGRRDQKGQKLADPRATRTKRLPLASCPRGQSDRTGPRARASRRRKEPARILDAAQYAPGRRPIAEICMDEVAQAAGVGKGTFYRRFVDRSSLCHALLDDNERRLQEWFFGLRPAASTPAVEQLMVLLDALLTFVIENAALLAEAEAFERGRATRYESPVYVWRRFTIARWIRQGHREGSLHLPSADPTADLLLAGMTADMVQWHLARVADENVVRAEYLAFWRRGLGLDPVSGSR